jgi:4-amino-4-deoxy-L-arabinose transferase-like glycosyltransferase
MTSRRRIISLVENFAMLAETRFLTFIITILILGTVLRLAAIALTTSPTEPLNILYPGYTDGEDYRNIAHSIIETGVYGYAGRPSAFRPPAYPVLMALIWKIFGETLTPVRLFQIALFVIMAICYTCITLMYFGRFAAALTAVVLSVYPLFVFMTTEIATESLYMTLASIVFALTFMLLDNKQKVTNKAVVAFAAGLCCGAGILTRPNMVFIFLLLQTFLILHLFGLSKRTGNWIAPSIGLWAGTFLVLTPWLIRNQLQIGAPVLTTNLDYNLFRGTFDLAPSTPNDAFFVKVFRDHHVMYEQDLENPNNRQLLISEVESERNARAAALAIIWSNPISWLKERMRNLVYLWLNLQWDPELIEKRPITLAAAISVSIIYYGMLMISVIGSIWIWRNEDAEQRSFVAVAWLFIAAAVPVIITFVGKRYRISMIDPYLVLLSCSGIAFWFRRLKQVIP